MTVEREPAPLLSVEHLTVRLGPTTLVDDVSFTLAAGSRLGIIGESGAGKTLMALAVMGLLPDGLSASGRVMLNGDHLLGRSERDLATRRGNSMSMIFQEPVAALDPVMRIGRQIAEPLRLHQAMSRHDAFDVVIELLASVGIDEPERAARSFPHEMSGGQRQRAMIAMALSCGPDLVIADEPTTALDVTIQARVLRVLQDQVVAKDAALILITHDLPVLASIVDDVVVLQKGAVVEQGPIEQVFSAGADPYTRRLVESVPLMSRSATISPRPSNVATEGEVIVQMRDVYKTYRLRRRRLTTMASVVHALDGVSLEVRRGETLGIVGESGSGKSTLARIMLGLVRATSGEVLVEGRDVRARSGLRSIRQVAQIVFQDPVSSLDPRMLVRDIVAEPLRSLRIEGDHTRRVAELLEAVSLPADAGGRYPHEFSGGERQRIAIARALAPGPRLLIADEPVSALDMTVQRNTLDLLDRLKKDFGLTMVFISHDLSVVYEICDRVVVLERGRVVESGPVGAVFSSPQRQYTRDLLAAIPRLDGSLGG